MEVVEEIEFKILQEILIENELNLIPIEISKKLEVYFNDKLNEYVTAKAVFQANRKNIDEKIENLTKELNTHKNQFKDCEEKLDLAEKYSAEIQSQLNDSRNECQRLQNSIIRLEKENSEFRRQKEIATDENDALRSQLDRRDSELERLRTELTSLGSQLQAAVAAKCQAYANMEEIKSREMTLDYKEKSLEREQKLMAQQMAGLEEEIAKRTAELQATRAEASNRALLTDTRLSQCEEELRIANDSIAQLRESNSVFQRRCEELAQKLEDQRNHELSMHASYREEVVAQTRLADLYKNIADESNMKADECTNAVKELQELVTEATEQYGLLETKHNETIAKYEQEVNEYTAKIEELSSELENANELLRSVKQDKLDQAVEQLAPTAAAASKILKKGLSLTQIYTQLVDTTNELTLAKEENDKLKIEMESILREIQEKAPVLQQQQLEYDHALENIETMTLRLEEILNENNRLQEVAEEAKQLANHHNRENQRLKSELSDLARQVCYLLKEVQESQTDSVVPMNDISAMDLDADLASSQIISKKLVTFKDIEELQKNNQKLLSIVRTLSTRQEEIEKANDEVNSGEMKEKLDRYMEQLADMKAVQDRQAKMVDGLLKQRDMYKNMYQQSLNQTLSKESEKTAGKKESENTEIDIEQLTEESLIKDTAVDKKLKKKLEDAEIRLNAINNDFKTYKQEKSIHEKMLNEEIERLRTENDKTSTRCCKLKAQLDSGNERFHLLQANVASYKSQIKTLEEKCNNYSVTIGKHEQSLMILKDEALSAQSRLSRAEVQLENLRQERQILRDSEGRLLKEREVLQRERQTQLLLKADVESIKASIERSQAEGQLRFEQRLDDATRECSALRRRLQEEQDRFRELTVHLERQAATAQEKLKEEKSLTSRLQLDLETSRQAEQENSKKIEELNSRLKQISSHSSISDLDDSNKKIKDLESQIANNQAEIKSLMEQLKAARNQSQQYCDISESAELQLQEITEKWNKEKTELEKAIKEAQDKENSMQNKIKSLQEQLSNSGTSISEQELQERLRLAEIKLEELDEVKGELELLKSDLHAATLAVNETEKKYANEMALHSRDLQILAKLKEENQSTADEIAKFRQERDLAVEALQAEKNNSIEREKSLQEQVVELEKRIKDMDAQNTLLHNQIQELSDKTAILCSGQNKTSGSESPDTSLECMNRSLTEEDSKSAEQLLRVMKYLRKEKDLVVAKFDVLRIENLRLKSQIEIAEKRLEETKNLIDSQREKSEIDVVTASKHSELLRKVETLNAITDSNRTLREERDALNIKVNELNNKLQLLSDEVIPLREKARDLEIKVDSLNQDNNALKAESLRWRQRANLLVERANKASPEDWRKLQNEREQLGKLLSSEREANAKRVEELNNVKTEKSKLEEQVSLFTKKIQTLEEQLTKLTDEKGKLEKQFEDSVNDSDTKAKTILGLKKEISDKDAILTETKNKEIQIRKIAKKYKTQYEELLKTTEEEKAKNEEKSITAKNETSIVLSQERENQLREEGRQELLQSNVQLNSRVEDLNRQLSSIQSESENLKKEIDTVNRESIAKEERAKEVLKSARNKIMQLTQFKKTCEKEISDLKAKVESSSSDADTSEYEARLVALKSQMDVRVSRLEHERNELQADKEALQQRISQLQRQLGVGNVSGVGAEPPTANIKPMSARTETPLASIRPMSVVNQSRTAAVLPTTASAPVLVAPQLQQQQAVHTTETSSPTSSHTDYQPASTSSSQTCANLRQIVVQPQTSDQSAESSQQEESERVETLSIQQQSCQQQQQTVALVSPRVEQQQQALPSDQQSVASSSTQSVSTSQASSGHKRPRTLDSSASGSCISEGEHSRQEQVSSPKTKRSRQQEIIPLASASATDIEYQVPTSSQRDQDEEGEEGCVVVDCDEGRGNEPQEEEEFDQDAYEEIEEEEELPYEVQVDNNEVEIMTEEDSGSVEVQPAVLTNQQQSEAISSAGSSGEPSFSSRSSRNVTPMSRQQQQQHLLLPQQGYEDGGDDCIVPSTPTLFVPRRNDGFGEAVSSPQVPQGRFTFGDQSAPSGSSGSLHVTPTLGSLTRSMFGSATTQVPQESMDDSRIDVISPENDSSGRSVPTTPLQVSPAADVPPAISSAHLEEQDICTMESGDSQVIVSDDCDTEQVEAPTVPTISIDEQENQQAESNTDLITLVDAEEQDDPGSSSSERLEQAGASESISVEETIGDDQEISDQVTDPLAQDDAKEENREAEASPSSNTRQRTAAAQAAAGTTPNTANTPRGSTARRSARTTFRAGRGNRPTPIVWGDSQISRGGPTAPRGHVARGLPNDGPRGRNTRGRGRMRAGKYPYSNF